MERVRDFLHLFKPSLICDAVAISDVYGPTAVDPNIQALVVSKETRSGAAASKNLSCLRSLLNCILKHCTVAKKRIENSLPPLQCFVIDVISATHHYLEDEDADKIAQTKLSSSFIREWLAHKSSSDSL